MSIALRKHPLHLVLPALLAAAPGVAAAQGPTLFEAFAARKEQSSTPSFGGIALTGYRGLFGLRVGGALNLANDDAAGTRQVVYYDPRCRDPRRCRQVVTQRGGDLSPFGVNVAGWSADADLLLEPLRPIPALKGLLLGFSPYAFVGIGGYSLRPAGGADTTFATVSYGGGLHHNLLGWLGLGAEARYRQPLDNAQLVTTTNALRDKVEYRVALTVSFGGKRRGPRAASRDEGTVSAPLPVVSAEPDEAPVVAAAPAQDLAARVMDLADGFVDTPYRYGGTSPESGFDGAGFVQYLFAQEGVRLPRTARQMAAVGTEVSTRVGSLRPGDLLFFANDGTTPDHVAIYVGRERIIHSSASGQGVRYDVLGEGERGQWFAEHLVAARRVVEPARRVQPRTPAPRDDLDRPDRAPKPAGSEP